MGQTFLWQGNLEQAVLDAGQRAPRPGQDSQWDEIWAEFDARHAHAGADASLVDSPRARRRIAPVRGRGLRRMAAPAAVLVMALVLWGGGALFCLAALGQALERSGPGHLEQMVDWGALRADLRRGFAGAVAEPNSGSFLQGMAEDLTVAASEPETLRGLLRQRLGTRPGRGPIPLLDRIERIQLSSGGGLTVGLGEPGREPAVSLRLSPDPAALMRWRVVGLDFPELQR